MYVSQTHVFLNLGWTEWSGQDGDNVSDRSGDPCSATTDGLLCHFKLGRMCSRVGRLQGR